MQTVSSLSIAGTGNVARHLGKELVKAGVRIEFVYGRSTEKTAALASLLGCKMTLDPSDLAGSDLILCAVSDNALPELIPQLSRLAPVATTSGTVNALALAHTHPVGVFYPLQTFSPNRETDLSHVPFFVEGSSADLVEQLKALAATISDTVTELSHERRAHLHLAAVFVNNFTNHLVDIAQQHLEQEKLPFAWLRPLLNETVDKLGHQSAKDAQTGPARRNDTQTIQHHISMLSPEDAQLYRLLSDSIRKRFDQI